jgi:hypothetical protein
METATSRVLIAAVPEAAARLRRILGAHATVVAQTLQEAQDALSRERFALAVLGVYFDESRMFDVMSSARASALNREVPIVCVLGLRGRLSAATVRMLQEIIDSMSACEFLNLAAIPDDDAGNALVRSRLARHLAPPPLAAAALPSVPLTPSL